MGSWLDVDHEIFSFSLLLTAKVLTESRIFSTPSMFNILLYLLCYAHFRIFCIAVRFVLIWFCELNCVEFVLASVWAAPTSLTSDLTLTVPSVPSRRHHSGWPRHRLHARWGCPSPSAATFTPHLSFTPCVCFCFYLFSFIIFSRSRAANPVWHPLSSSLRRTASQKSRWTSL